MAIPSEAGRKTARPVGRRTVMALAAAPVAVVIVIAAATAADPGNTKSDLRVTIQACINDWIPLHSGYEEEIRAIMARGDEPGLLAKGTDEYIDYFAGASRAGTDPGLRGISRLAGVVPEGLDDKTAAMAAVTVINWVVAPPGQCVWEHEYIAGGGNLSSLEYDRDLKCYLADNPTGSPAPYEIADAGTQALIGRAGPAPGGGDVFNYVAQNTRVEMLAEDPDQLIRDALNHSNGNAYRAIKTLNLFWNHMWDGCVNEAAWATGGGRLSDLEYAEDLRCYLAPTDPLAWPQGACSFYRPQNPWGL